MSDEIKVTDELQTEFEEIVSKFIEKQNDLPFIISFTIFGIIGIIVSILGYIYF